MTRWAVRLLTALVFSGDIRPATSHRGQMSRENVPCVRHLTHDQDDTMGREIAHCPGLLRGHSSRPVTQRTHVPGERSVREASHARSVPQHKKRGTPNSGFPNLPRLRDSAPPASEQSYGRGTYRSTDPAKSEISVCGQVPPPMPEGRPDKPGAPLSEPLSQTPTPCRERARRPASAGAPTSRPHAPGRPRSSPRCPGGTCAGTWSASSDTRSPAASRAACR